MSGRHSEISEAYKTQLLKHKENIEFLVKNQSNSPEINELRATLQLKQSYNLAEFTNLQKQLDQKTIESENLKNQLDQHIRINETIEIKNHEDIFKVQEQNLKISYERDQQRNEAMKFGLKIKQMEDEIQFFKNKSIKM